MPHKPTTTRKRRDNPDKATYLHHLEQISVHLGAARQLAPNADARRFLQTVGKNIAILYRRAGGNPDATNQTD